METRGLLGYQVCVRAHARVRACAHVDVSVCMHLRVCVFQGSNSDCQICLVRLSPILLGPEKFFTGSHVSLPLSIPITTSFNLQSAQSPFHVVNTHSQIQP